VFVTLFNAVSQIRELQFIGTDFLIVFDSLNKELNRTVTGTHFAINAFMPDGDPKQLPDSWNKFFDRLDHCTGEMDAHIAKNKEAYEPEQLIYTKISERSRALVEYWNDSGAFRRALVHGCVDTFSVADKVRKTSLASVDKFVVLNGMLCAQIYNPEHRLSTRIALKPVVG